MGVSNLVQRIHFKCVMMKLALGNGNPKRKLVSASSTCKNICILTLGDDDDGQLYHGLTENGWCED